MSSIDAASRDVREGRQRVEFPFVVDLVGGRGFARLLADLLWLHSDDEVPVGGSASRTQEVPDLGRDLPDVVRPLAQSLRSALFGDSVYDSCLPAPMSGASLCRSTKVSVKTGDVR